MSIFKFLTLSLLLLLISLRFPVPLRPLISTKKKQRNISYILFLYFDDLRYFPCCCILYNCPCTIFFIDIGGKLQMSAAYAISTSSQESTKLRQKTQQSFIKFA